MNTQELLWKYAEGVCNLHEIAQMEKLLANDPSLQNDLDSILEVQSVLMTMEAEAPSLRFSKNVLDTLPVLYPSEAIEPLIKPVWKILFWLSVAAILATLFLLPRSSSSMDIVSPYTDQLIGSVNQVVGEVPVLVLEYFVLTLLSATMLMLFDQLMKKKFRPFFLV